LGNFNFSSPTNNSLCEVVDERINDIITPIVAFIKIFHPAHNPGSESLKPKNSILGSVPKIGKKKANKTKGISIISLFLIKPSEIRFQISKPITINA
jgi:hypothetical protein